MARPFRFKLEKVLEYRRQVEDQARLALAKAQLAYQEQAELLDRLRAELEVHERRLSNMDGLTAGEIWLLRNYRERLLQDVRQAERKLHELAKELSRCREEAVLRSKERKVLEKLKERQAERYGEEQSLQEQKELDEIGTLRHQRKDQ